MLSLVDELLAEQQTLQTPVARFSFQHDNDTIETPALEPVYRDLIPLSQPGPGEQYAFEVDLDACSGCKACVAGCHSLNGLDEEETWRDIGHLVGGSEALPFQQTVTSACHHCADPGCLNGCPVLAYEKDPITGIVRHLDDQCIGCSYCILKCPYDVPKFSERLGIVRKCDMCQGRLAEGEAPACVQACPTQAISIVKVSIDLSGSRPTTDTSAFLPGAPDPATTQPTTRYVSKRALPANLHAADLAAPKAQHAHWPLVLLLSLTQAGYGLSLAASFTLRFDPILAYTALALSTVGLAAAGAHLGRPLRAWRIFLGLRRSWLSREAVIMGGWFPLLGAAIILPRWPQLLSPLPTTIGLLVLDGLPIAAAVTGAIALFCSAMIYIDTPRQFWRAPATFTRMGGTILVGALLPVAPLVAAIALAAKLVFESNQQRADTPSGKLLRTVLRPAFRLRNLLGISALALLVTYWVTNEVALIALGAIAWLAGEIVERYLYFRAVDSAKMPGVAAS
ncbi:dimethyl sulfoxide reductase anchor subunit [Synoicihabitans lomoniglobus]|uniref:Dimethyl sulfoxide reductase anchor subunit n=2 Tax=Synoicihabitans lomoniglobus TaxID=2909285 RepID=A0AAF0CRM2_9BACT|nr:dimethyl sulfoxide reductase anchor subunit [Opitutaceae bacterium LMO-M01]